MWHRRCYKQRINDNYPIAVLKDKDGMRDPKELKKFKYGKNGDHLISPFQCDLCHFRNIQRRDPEVNVVSEKKLLVVISRVNLDAFWGRIDHTVVSNRVDVKQILHFVSNYLGITSIFPEMGPHAIADHWGWE